MAMTDEEFDAAVRPRPYFDSLLAEARRARASEKRLLALLGECVFLIDPSEASARYDKIADDFYRETLLMAPGKDVAAAMGYTLEDEERRRRLWSPFVNQWWEATAKRLRAAIQQAEE